MALAPTLSWENGVVQEPNVFTDGTTWHMVYTGGFSSPALGHATASTPAGPWTKDAGPFLGQGHGGEAGAIGHANVYVEGTTVYYFYPSAINGGNLQVATAPLSNPTSITLVGTCLTTTASATGHVNSYLIKDGSTYRMLFESKLSTTPPPTWATGYATATSPTGPFTIQNYPLSTLQNSGGSYGGPWFTKSGSTYIAWYHIAAASNDLPTALFRATSSDMVTWTVSNGGLAEVPRRAYEEYDQTADPFIVTDSSGQTWWFWSGMKNTSPQWGYIMRSNPPGSTLTI